jgi:hypothetical protein
MILDSEEDQGLVMVDSEVTVDSIFNELTTDERFTQDEKCQSLFSMSYSGDEFPIERFNAYDDGYCLTLDYSDLLEIMGEEEGDDDD